MPLFGKSQKSPAELVRSLKDAVTALERGDKKAEKAQEDVSKNLVSVLDPFMTLCYRKHFNRQDEISPDHGLSVR